MIDKVTISWMLFNCVTAHFISKSKTGEEASQKLVLTTFIYIGANVVLDSFIK